ncbi:MAG: right-handed parallel beta-helix repeat-containing protein [Clostridia bacterium]|nr:right-handed parallel beta-helix repeat-containing protein [Clostridia bacterium]
MKKSRIISLLLAVTMVFSLLPFTAMAEEADKIIIHVDSNSKFAGDGSEAKPFQTIEAAKTYLRSKDHRKKQAEIIVHAGVYPQELALTFTTEDSGTEKYPVIYRAAGDGEVRVSSAITLNHMDFKPIQDKETINRLPDEVQSKVGVLDLSEYKMDWSMVDYTSRTTDPREPEGYVYLSLNDKRQELAKYPNVGWEYINTVVKQGELISSGTKGERGEWKYTNLRPERWEKADQAVIRGYLGSEYAMDWTTFGGVNLESKTMFLGWKSIYGVSAGHRWRIENLLEEVDSPGEFFIDKNTKKLYYYPPYKLKTTDKLTLSTYSKSYIYVNGASNIIFDGINVSDSVDNYAYYINKSDNITVRNATISNIGGYRAIYVNESRNCLIEACELYDIHGHGIELNKGGDKETLSPSGNRVANCHFFNWGTGGSMFAKYAVCVGRNAYNETIGDVVENNIMHGQPNAQAIQYGSLENKIRYNEMHSLTQDAADMGVVYCGRKMNEWHNELSYNYIHTFAPIFEARYKLQGIYWDDWQSGQIAHHNIIVPGSKKSTSGNLFVGADSYYCENIIVNSATGVHAQDRGSKIHDTAYNTTLATHSANSPAILAKYPRILEYREQLDKDGRLLLCANNVFCNNLSVDVNQNAIKQVHIDNGKVENNQITDDYGVFVDAANHDWRLKREYVKEFGYPDTFINEDNFSMDQIGIQKDVWDIQKPATPFKLLYPSNGDTQVIRNLAYIKWEYARFADIYEYVVATDPELKNVVASGKSLYNVVQLPDLKNDTVYYYKVWATNQGKQLGNTWPSDGVPYMFKTTKEDVLEKEMLNDEIKNVKALRKTVEANIGEELGQFSADAVSQIDAILAEAQALSNKATGRQEDIQDMIAKLQNLQDGITGYKNKGHAALNIEKGKWAVSSAATTATQAGDTVTIDALGSGWAWLDEINQGYMVKHFKMKINYKGWTGLSFKQSDTSMISYKAALKNYLIVIKENQIEFQKYNPAAAKTGIITTYPNDYIKEDTWVDIEMGAVDVPGGVNVFLKVNGNMVFSEFDTDTPNFGDGYFVVYPGSEGAKVQLKQMPAADIPTEPFVYEGSAPQMSDAKTISNPSSKNAVKTGNFTEISDTTIDGSKVQVSTDANAQIVYTVTDTEVPYKTYYYHKPTPGGDPNATISLVAYSPTTGGKTNVTKTIDFSQGEEGWVYLGTYECASWGKTGDIVFTIKGSGQGTLVAPAIGVTKADKELLEFNRTFYDYAENLLLMKVDSQTAYSVMDELTIPDVAPYIENGRTMVPLRFVSEAFGAQVDWDAATQTATITSGENVVKFTLGNKTYTANGVAKESETEAKLVNGRTMIPLRATVEALGKKVMWYGDAKLIFIADKLNFTEADTAKLQTAAKGFERGFN